MTFLLIAIAYWLFLFVIGLIAFGLMTFIAGGTDFSDP